MLLLRQARFHKPPYAYAGVGRHLSPDKQGVLRTLQAISFALALSLLTIIGSATAQSQINNDLANYTAAVAQPDRPTRLRALDSYVRDAPPSWFRMEGMVYLAWEYLQAGQRERAAEWAQQLLLIDPDDSFALALVADNSRSSEPLDNRSAQQVLEDSKRGLTSLPRLQRPMGMPAAEFERVRLESLVLLKGAAGEAELYRKNYAAARTDLSDALALSPEDPRNTYALARAYLDGKGADPKQGYWYLARAVNLSQGSPQGAQIAQYARERYMKEGGSDAAWQQFLAATRLPGQASGGAELAKAEAPGIAPTQSAKVSTSAPVRPATGTRSPAEAAQSASQSTRQPPAQTATIHPPVAGERKQSGLEANVWADLTPPTDIGPQHLPVTSTGPVSLGILIEASLARQENRNALVASLTDMLRRLGENDEAFVLGYSENLIFEEDLTEDPHQLEAAIEQIKPQRGAALDDAVVFAAGHLARIAKNPRRELLVISDGRNMDSRVSTGQTLAAINAAGVRIYCIGMDVDALDSRNRLQRLSASTGGHSRFISDPEQLREATKQIAQNMGINFRF